MSGVSIHELIKEFKRLIKEDVDNKKNEKISVGPIVVATEEFQHIKQLVGWLVQIVDSVCKTDTNVLLKKTIAKTAICITAIHVRHNCDRETKKEFVEALLQVMAFLNISFIIAGDWNLELGPNLCQFAEILGVSVIAVADGRTGLPSKEHAIDYMFYSSDLRLLERSSSMTEFNQRITAKYLTASETIFDALRNNDKQKLLDYFELVYTIITKTLFDHQGAVFRFQWKDIEFRVLVQSGVAEFQQDGNICPPWFSFVTSTWKKNAGITKKKYNQEMSKIFLPYIQEQYGKSYQAMNTMSPSPEEPAKAILKYLSGRHHEMQVQSLKSSRNEVIITTEVKIPS